MNIITVNEIDKTHLQTVISDMKRLGSPTIKAVWVEAWDCWVALEGSHRIHAAKELGLSLDIDEIEYSSALVGDHVITDDTQWMTVEEFVDSAWLSANLMVEV